MITSPEAGTGVLQAYENTGSDTSAQWLFNLGMISGIPQFDDMRGGCAVDLNGDDRPDFLAYRAFSATSVSSWDSPSGASEHAPRRRTRPRILVEASRSQHADAREAEAAPRA
jgi:hypothetical protein